jgi:hypothetical protein
LSAIAEEHVTGGAPSSADANLDAVPTDKEDIVNVDDNRAMVAAVIATPNTKGDNDAREVIVLALLSPAQCILTVISLVMNTFFSSFNDVELPHSMLVDCCMSCCQNMTTVAADDQI